MTDYSARLSGKKPSGSNKKDGATGQGPRRNNNQDAEFERLGFTMTDWNKWGYTWPGNFPVISLVPGLVDFEPGWVAIYKATGRQIPIGQVAPEEIKARLDDLILEILRHDAELDNERLDELDEDVDLWMTRPQTAARRSTPAVKELAKRHGIRLDVADEIMTERGE